MEETKNSLSQQLAKIDPDFYEYLQDNDCGLLDEMVADSDASVPDDDQGEGLMQSDQSSADDDMGTVEPRPLHITSRKEVRYCQRPAPLVGGSHADHLSKTTLTPLT